MRVAVPTEDGVSVARHFGRSAAFLVFEVENGQVIARESRTNPSCHSHAEGEHSHGAHDHGNMISILAGCDVVLCGGMGWRAAEALKSAGITPVMAGVCDRAEDLVLAYVQGRLTPSEENYCHCHQ